MQPLPIVYGTNDATNNTAELLARVLAYKLNTQIISSTIQPLYTANIWSCLVHHIYNNRQRTRTVFPAISWMLAQRLDATITRDNLPPIPPDKLHCSPGNGPPILMESILAQIREMFPCGKTWIPSKHITIVDNTVPSLTSSGQINIQNTIPVYNYAWLMMYIVTIGLTKRVNPHTDLLVYSFSLRCSATRIISPLYIHPMNMCYYGLYPVEIDVSDFSQPSLITLNSFSALPLNQK